MTFYFNQNIKYNGGVAINGKKYERITNVTTSGPALTITYEGFDINTDYTITFPAGCVTSMNGDKLLEEAATFNFSTCDFGSLDDIKDTHKGCTAPLPINFKPFDVIGLLERENRTTQENSNEHPHWVQVSRQRTSITPNTSHSPASASPSPHRASAWSA